MTGPDTTEARRLAGELAHIADLSRPRRLDDVVDMLRALCDALDAAPAPDSDAVTAIAAALSSHRQEHDPKTGAAKCACGRWEGPYTMHAVPWPPGRKSYAEHTAEVAVRAVCGHDRAAGQVMDTAPTPDSDAVTAVAEALREAWPEWTAREEDQNLDRLWPAAGQVSMTAVRAVRGHDRAAGKVTVNADDLRAALEMCHSSPYPTQRQAITRLVEALGGAS